MASPYTQQSASGYNSNPPADDGTVSAANQVFWATIKTKLGDPVKTLADAIDDAIATAFGLTLSGASVVSHSTDYTILSSDQGKLLRQTGSSKTFTTPDATSVASPFVLAILNSSSTDLTIDGSGAQTVNGASTVTVPAGQGVILFTDGSNWFCIGSILTTAALTVASLTATTVTATGAVSGATVAGAMVAAKSDMETATATNLIVTPGRQQNHPGVAKAWGHITNEAGTPAIGTSHNVTSVSDGGVGIITINLTTAFSGTDFAVICTPNDSIADSGDLKTIVVASRTASTIVIHTYAASSSVNASLSNHDYSFSFMAFGDQ